MSAMSGVRKAIYKAIGKQRTGTTLAAETDNVVPFPGATVRKKKVAKKKTKTYDRITPYGDEFLGTTKKGRDFFKKETIKGKPYMRRDDGALFRLRKDGKWVMVGEPRVKGVAGGGGSLVPYAIGAGAVAAGGIAGYEYGRRKK